eukprot:gene2392-2856_t
MKRWFYFVALCLTFLTTIQAQERCYLAGNNYISWRNTTTNYHFKLRFENCLTGWCAFSFSKNSSIDGSISLLIIFNHQNVLKTLVFPKHQNLYQNETKEVENKYEGIAYWEVFNINNFFMNISKQIYPNSFDHLIIVSNDKEKPYLTEGGQWVIPKHNFVDIRDLKKEENFCFENSIYPLVLEQTNIYVFFGFLIVYVILIFLTIYFRNDQPLKSRGIFPIIAVVFGYWSLFQNFGYHFQTLEWRQKYYCFFQGVGYVPTITSQCFILSVYCLRITLTLTLNNNKNYIRNQKGKLSIFFRFILFLKYMTSDIFMVISASLLYLFIVVEVFAYQLITNGTRDCRTKPELVEPILLVSFIAVAIVYLIDFILMIKQLFCCRLRALCCKDDPFYFRSQQWIVGGSIVVMMIITILYGFSAIFILDPIKNDIQQAPFQIFIYYILEVLFSIFFYSTVFYFNGYVLLITIIKKFISLCKKKQKDSQSESSKAALINCLNDEELCNLFKKFSDSEWSSENYLMYFDILLFQNLKRDEQEEFARQMFNNYLNGYSAPLEVNVVQQLSIDIKHRIDNDDYESDMFDVIYDEVVKNLLDTFSRFRSTRWYLNFIETRVFVESQL